MKSSQTKVILAVIATVLFGGAIVGSSSADPEQRGQQPLLGSKDFAPLGRGFGTVKPKQIHNGGVPSGWVHNIRWRNWGKPVAYGVGRGHQYKPKGGYYKRHVNVRFRATRLGYCGDSNREAYTLLKVRIQKKPGGSKLTKWFRWAGAGTICEW